VGISPHSNPNYQLMKEAGIEWLRIYFGYPFEDHLRGKLTKEFQETLKRVKDLRNMGFKIMGVTPTPGVISWDKTLNKPIWQKSIPEWAGTYDSDKFYEAYREGCKELGRKTIGLVDIWQIANEMDIDVFRGPMTVEQAARFLKAGSIGIKEGNPEAKTSINPAGMNADSRYLFKVLYSKNEHIFDYAGIDGYFGSWSPGGPDNWPPVIEEIHRITGAPVLVHEWGYSSIGSVQESPKEAPPEGWNWVCIKKAWFNVWKKEHSEREQAEYVAVVLEMFAKLPNLIGSFFFDWGDEATCYHCGQPNCPAECGWGLTDSQGRPKPAYYTFKETVKKFY